MPFLRASIAPHNGRPTVFIDGQPTALAAYSPVAGRRPELLRAQTARFFPHQLDAYFLSLSPAQSSDYFATPFWEGDTISSEPLLPMHGDMDAEARWILEANPQAGIIVRFGPTEPQSWRDLHCEELVVNEAGEVLPCPSMASALYDGTAKRFVAAVVQWCEGRDWASRIIGYWPGHRVEGSHEPLLAGDLFDCGPRMTHAWRAFLRAKYRSPDHLREFYGPEADFDTISVPRDRLRGPQREVSALPYWQNHAQNAPLRDYLELQRELWHRRFRGLAGAMQEALQKAGRERFVVWDALKQPMQGWSNHGFFDAATPWPIVYPDTNAGSGQMAVASLLDAPGCDGLITPHDYQARGAGGVYEPEGAADSCVLRGKLFLCEMDTRTWRGSDINFPARDLKEFEAVTWRNLASSWTRGFTSYWMDVYQDWFSDEAIHAVIARQVEAHKASLQWPHSDVPGIAVIIDDECVLETNGNGHILNEHVAWEWRGGLARCGVPFRIYLLQDLELHNFPDHRVFYFPNLYRADEKRLRLLRDKVFGKNRVVVWGPGSGISDGQTLSPEHAARLTGFEFDWLAVNDPRRVQISDFSHPITRALSADTLFGSPTAYGPVLFPRGGVELGRAFAKGGRDCSGLSLKRMNGPGGEWFSLFSVAAPLPASLWREIACFAGAHVYSESGDILLANSSLVALHSLKSERKNLSLPGRFRVRDVTRAEELGVLDSITFDLDAPETRVFHLVPHN